MIFQLSVKARHIIRPSEGLNLRSDDFRLQRAYFVAHWGKGGNTLLVTHKSNSAKNVRFKM